MASKALTEHLETVAMKPQPLKKFRTYLVVLLLPLVVLCGCGTTVYEDRFDSTPIGQTPGPPQIGTSSVSGDVLIAENPIVDVSSDRWLQLKRASAVGAPAVYEARLNEPVTAGGSVTLKGYIPAYAPAMLTVYFNTPQYAPQATLLHIDLLQNGNILVNDDTIEGTFEFNTTIVFLIVFDLDAPQPTATILVLGGGENANTTVEVPGPVAGFGLGRVRVHTPFEGVNSSPGRFFINEVVARKSSE